MCFSAASFTAGALLLGAGILAVKSARGPRELPLAAIPLLFSIQQLIEGVVWLTFRYEAPLLNAVMTHAYSFFSHVLWPVYVPVAVLLIEPTGGAAARCGDFPPRARPWPRTSCTPWWRSPSSLALQASTSSTSLLISSPLR